jgi:hypothetical protein
MVIAITVIVRMVVAIAIIRPVPAVAPFVTDEMCLLNERAL